MAKTKPIVEFEPAPTKIGSGWCVPVTLHYRVSPRLGFKTEEEEARDWIARKSVAHPWTLFVAIPFLAKIAHLLDGR